MNDTILIVDDDPEIGNMVEEVLDKAGYASLRAYSGTEALLVLERHRPDVILLDLMLPGLSGEALLPKLEGIPVIVVSAKGDVTDKVHLLRSGAVDYITKPFDTKELLARIEVQCRRGPSGSRASIYTCGDLSLDTTSHQVMAGGVPVALTKTEYAILKQLLQNAGRVMAKSVLLDRISLDTPDCTERSLKQHVSNLRRKLYEASGKEYIEAVWGIGFLLKILTQS